MVSVFLNYSSKLAMPKRRTCRSTARCVLEGHSGGVSGWSRAAGVVDGVGNNFQHFPGALALSGDSLRTIDVDDAPW